MTEWAGEAGSGGTGTDPSSCSRTFCCPVSLRYWMKCLRAVCLDSNSRNRTSEHADRRVNPGQQCWTWIQRSALTFTQRPLQVNQNLVGEKDSASSDVGNKRGCLNKVTAVMTFPSLVPTADSRSHSLSRRDRNFSRGTT